MLLYLWMFLYLISFWHTSPSLSHYNFFNTSISFALWRMIKFASYQQLCPPVTKYSKLGTVSTFWLDMLQTYGAVGKCCSLSCEGGMMIEYMSTIILTGCGPEVCMTSNNARHWLKHQAEQEARGEERRKQVMETAWALERKKGAKKETQVNRKSTQAPSWLLQSPPLPLLSI